MFCCWKCGSGSHIGDRCTSQSKTFDELFNGSITDSNFEAPTWALVVKRGFGESEDQQRIQKDMEARLKEENKKKERIRQE